MLSLQHDLPPNTPYDIMRKSSVGEKVATTKAVDAMIPPEIQTGRHPNLFVSPLAMGPE